MRKCFVDAPGGMMSAGAMRSASAATIHVDDFSDANGTTVNGSEVGSARSP